MFVDTKLYQFLINNRLYRRFMQAIGLHGTTDHTDLVMKPLRTDEPIEFEFDNSTTAEQVTTLFGSDYIRIGQRIISFDRVRTLTAKTRLDVLGILYMDRSLKDAREARKRAAEYHDRITKTLPPLADPAG